MIKKFNNGFEETLIKLASIVQTNSYIDPALYDQYKVKRGLRNKNGTGVLVGITKIADVVGYEIKENIKIPIEGELYYHGINMVDIIKGSEKGQRRSFEEVIYLLLFGNLPNKEQLDIFNGVLESCRKFPNSYTEDAILKIPSTNIMNKLQRAILALYSYDKNPEDISVSNVLSQSINLIAKLPLLAAYSYKAKKHYYDDDSLIIHPPKKGAGIAENLLHLMRNDSEYTKEEVDILDLFLTIHADHGGGTNSSFAIHVVSSTGTDTYSALSTAIGSLKGPKHGGANLKVTDMINNIKENVIDWDNEAALEKYLYKILNKEVFDKEGLIYGMGHAVYTLSDPRAVILKEKAMNLAKLKGKDREFNLIANIEAITKRIFYEKKGDKNPISANVDLYSGFVLEMLDIPRDLYTPLFAVSRISGWCAHRLEQVQNEKIIRPAYVCLGEKREYIPIENR